MKTLIELYDERTIENMIGPETFRPSSVVYLCPAEIAQNKELRRKHMEFFRHRGMECDIVFLDSSIYKAEKILAQLEDIYDHHEDCALDITGGTDAALFAAGMFSRNKDIPVFTYSRTKNRFYSINNAPFADNVTCDLHYKVLDFFLMAGGNMRKGRVDNAILSKYDSYYIPYFELYLKYRKRWSEFIVYMQKASFSPKGEAIILDVNADFTLKGERGQRVNADPGVLRAHEALGFIKNLKIEDQSRVSFTIKDAQIRDWMRDAGSVLELYMYKICKDTGIFDDVVSSAIVDWDGTVTHDSVSNEIDVVATRGVVPLFISCKTCEIKTEALNELAILKERFGGKGAKACIVTTETCNAAARHRAARLGITVIDLEELMEGDIGNRLRVIMKVIQD